MANKPYKGFSPKWVTEAPPKGSFREIYKWGTPEEYKYPKEGLYNYMKETFGFTDDDFKTTNDLGLEKVDMDIPVTLEQKHVDALAEMVGGKDFISTKAYDRIWVSYGKTMVDSMRLRKHFVEHTPDVVLYPDNHEQIQKIVLYCSENKIPVYVYGGGSSVTRGTECMVGKSITLDLSKRFNKLIEFNEVDQTVTVQAGMSGPDIEKLLNNAIETLKAKRNYTVGHFPQSFEHSSVGGWVVTKGAGQNSTYYGKAEDIVFCQRYATPLGELKTDKYPRQACGPYADQIMMGSEGTFGVLTDVTFRIFRYHPEDRQRFSYMFKNWADARACMKEVMQSECGKPSVFRLSDPEETEIMMRMYNVDEMPLVPQVLKTLGYKGVTREMMENPDPMQVVEGQKDSKCMMLGYCDGDPAYQKLVKRNVRKIAKQYGAISMTGAVTKSWEHGRFTDPCMRETLQDFNIYIDTLETTVTWSQMEEVWKNVKAYCHERPKTIVMTHMSHIYEQGANLYFIWISPFESYEDFVLFHGGVLDAIQKAGGSMSHHHGIGKLFAPWLEGQLGTPTIEAFKTLKEHFDPNHVMNPGGTLGLDLPESKKVFKDAKWDPKKVYPEVCVEKRYDDIRMKK